jgi:hypothetical protein
MRDPRKDKSFQVLVTFEVQCYIKVEARDSDEALRYAKEEEDLPHSDEWEYSGNCRYFVSE